MPHLITKAEIAASVKDRFAKQYGPKFGVYNFGDTAEIYRKLVALGDSPLPADIENLMPGWCRLVCNECGREVEVIVEVGEEPDYESSTAAICQACAEAACRLFNQKKEPIGDPVLSSLPNESEQIKMLVKENAALRKAGSRLARRALYVIAEFDGLHRLALAASDWAKALGDEHGRGETSKVSTCEESK